MTSDQGAFEQAHFSYEAFGPSLSRGMSTDPAEPYRQHVLTVTIPFAGPTAGQHNLQNLKRIQGMNEYNIND